MLDEPRLIEQPENLAYPLTTRMLVPPVQLSVPPAGLLAIVRLTTVVLSVVTTWLEPLRTATTGCCPQIAAAWPPPGCVVKARCWRLIRNELLVAAVHAGVLVAVSVYELVEPLLIEHPENAATPLSTVRLLPFVHVS